MLLTSHDSVELVEEFYTLHGERAPAIFNFSGTGVVVALQPVKKLRKAGRSLVWWVLVRLLLFHCMPAGRHSDSTQDSGRVCLRSRIPRGSYGAGSPTAVICSRELVGCGNWGSDRGLSLFLERELNGKCRSAESEIEEIR